MLFRFFLDGSYVQGKKSKVCCFGYILTNENSDVVSRRVIVTDSSFDPDISSIKAELYSLYIALDFIQVHLLVFYPKCSVEIYTDSSYVAKIFTRECNFVTHKTLWSLIFEYQSRLNKYINISIVQIPRNSRVFHAMIDKEVRKYSRIYKEILEDQ